LRITKPLAEQHAAEDLGRDAVAGTLDDLDRVPGEQLARLDHAHVGAEAQRPGEALDESRLAELRGQLRARLPRLGDLDERRADPPPLADLGVGGVESRHSQVLAEQARLPVAIELASPVLVILDRVCVESLVIAAVVAAVGDVIAFEAVGARLHRAIDRPLEDARLDRPPAHLQEPELGHVDRAERAAVAHSQSRLRK
jgi:hypothetical protein